jgi:hypothetical protein
MAMTVSFVIMAEVCKNQQMIMKRIQPEDEDEEKDLHLIIGCFFQLIFMQQQTLVRFGLTKVIQYREITSNESP